MQKFLNNYKTTLHESINDTIDLMYVKPATEFDEIEALTSGDYYILTIDDGTNMEIVKVTAVSIGANHGLTIERDVSDQAHGSFAFAAGATVEMRVTGEALNLMSAAVDAVDYPPNYTVNQTTVSAGSTQAIPFTPLVIQQVNIEVASGVTINIQPGATYGESVIMLYRAATSHAWPTLQYNGSAVPVAGDPPASGYNAKLVCRSEPGAGYLPNPFVTFEWITRSAVSGGGGAAVNSAFSSDQTVLDHGITYTVDGGLVVDPTTQGLYHSGVFQAGTFLDIFPTSWDYTLKELIFYSEGYTGIPAIRLGGGVVTPLGTAPTAGDDWALRVTLIAPYKAVLEWLKLATY